MGASHPNGTPQPVCATLERVRLTRLLGLRPTHEPPSPVEREKRPEREQKDKQPSLSERNPGEVVGNAPSRRPEPEPVDRHDTQGDPLDEKQRGEQRSGVVGLAHQIPKMGYKGRPCKTNYGGKKPVRDRRKASTASSGTFCQSTLSVRLAA